MHDLFSSVFSAVSNLVMIYYKMLHCHSHFQIKSVINCIYVYFVDKHCTINTNKVFKKYILTVSVHLINRVLSVRLRREVSSLGRKLG